MCLLSDINDPGSKGFVFGIGSKRFDMFIVRKNGAVFGYINSCPHLGTPLEFLTDKFLNKKKTSIVCFAHNAQFNIADGYCFAGPCTRESLISVPLEICDDQIKMGVR